MARGSFHYKGEDIVTNEEMLACNQPDVVLDWLDTIGGIPLIEHTYRVFSQDLTVKTLLHQNEDYSKY